MSLTTEHIENLLSLCKKGNQLAQMEVYNRYYPAMYTTAFNIIKNSAEAEDVMQESFLTAFSKLHTFQGTATFGAWLKRIVINKSITYYRKNKQDIEINDERTILKIADEEETDSINYEELKAGEVIYSLQQLKENYRLILTLHYLEGYDYDEICQIMKMSYANCRTMISRAKDSLRKKLRDKSSELQTEF